MRTIKAMIKDFLSKAEKEIETGEPVSEKNEENDNELLTQNQKEDETESDENPGVAPLVATASEEVERQDQGVEESAGGEEQKSAGEQPKSAGGVDEFQEAVKAAAEAAAREAAEEAYQRGLIDGRNQQIREKYFPNEEDGVPHFEGSAYQPYGGNDIFAIASKA